MWAITDIWSNFINECQKKKKKCFNNLLKIMYSNYFNYSDIFFFFLVIANLEHCIRVFLLCKSMVWLYYDIIMCSTSKTQRNTQLLQIYCRFIVLTSKERSWIITTVLPWRAFLKRVWIIIHIWENIKKEKHGFFKKYTSILGFIFK